MLKVLFAQKVSVFWSYILSVFNNQPKNIEDVKSESIGTQFTFTEYYR